MLVGSLFWGCTKGGKLQYKFVISFWVINFIELMKNTVYTLAFCSKMGLCNKWLNLVHWFSKLDFFTCRIYLSVQPTEMSEICFQLLRTLWIPGCCPKLALPKIALIYIYGLALPTICLRSLVHFYLARSCIKGMRLFEHSVPT